MILAAWQHTIYAFIFAMFCLLLMLVILLQRGRGVGLSGAFGGGGAAGGAFGAKTGDLLTWVTVVGAGIFLLLAVALNYAFRPGPVASAGPALVEAGTPGAPGVNVPAAPPGAPPGTMIKVDPSGTVLETVPLPEAAPTPPPAGDAVPPPATPPPGEAAPAGEGAIPANEGAPPGEQDPPAQPATPPAVPATPATP